MLRERAGFNAMVPSKNTFRNLAYYVRRVNPIFVSEIRIEIGQVPARRIATAFRFKPQPDSQRDHISSRAQQKGYACSMEDIWKGGRR